MKIFISYRRQDSEWVTLSLFNLLKQQMPNDSIFKDFNVIRPGEDFTKVIANNLGTCDVLLVVIGEQWLSCKNEEGKQRIFEPSDYVAFEISTALVKGKKVIPVLVNNTRMPGENELPDSIKELYKLQAVKVDSNNFEMDVFNLSNSIMEIAGRKNQYNQLVKDFVAGNVRTEDMVKPDSNMAYSIICSGLGLILMVILASSPVYIAICIAIIMCGGYAYYLSRKVKPYWLNKNFLLAKKAARNTRLIGLIAPISGLIILGLVAFTDPEIGRENNTGERQANDSIVNRGGASIVDAVKKEEPEQATPHTAQTATKSVKSIPPSDYDVDEDLSEYIVLQNTSIFSSPDINTLTDYFLYEGSVVELEEIQYPFSRVNFQDDTGDWFTGWVASADIEPYVEYEEISNSYLIAQNTSLFLSPNLNDLTDYYLYQGSEVELIEEQYPFAHVQFLGNDGELYEGWVASDDLVTIE